ncbi:MAG: ATP-dependent DNA ligase [Methanobacteriota archaeon]|nr:MAG: ATP-dependent DNA ligase [Euryarchaeota archaeon]
MDYGELVQVYEALGATPAKLEKTQILAELFRRIPPHLLPIIPHLITGDIFPEQEMELGIGPGLLYNAVSFVTGVGKGEIEDIIREEGDTGRAVKRLFERRPQKTLYTETLTVERVHEIFTSIARSKGSGAQDRKIKYLAELFSSATPLEAMYLVRTVLSELRVGVAEGLLRDAIALAFEVDVKAVERAFMLTNDLGLVAKVARESGEEGLRRLTVTVGRPLRPMLAQAAPSLEEALKEGDEVAVEIKYDGARVQIHKKGKDVRIFSRRLEDVTEALPDVAGYALASIGAGEAIVDGEAVAVDPETKRPRPFQEILRRFRRKYDIQQTAQEIPFETHIFDILYKDGELLIDRPFRERRKMLEALLKEEKGRFMLAKQLVTGDIKEAERFYHDALSMGHEGVMVKNLDARYVIGSRVGYMYKVKPVAETLDLVIIGAIWGEGKRRGWLSSYYLGARDELGEFRYVGRVATGVTEEQLEEYTRLLKPLIEFQDGKEVRLMPEVVVEVGYQEIQRSPKYDSGFALRFPRLIRLRDDKSPAEADTIERVEELYRKQGASKKDG